jgi:hypothetical protein
MANANPSRIGQVNGAGDARALMLKVYGGEVLGAFDRQSAFRQRHMVRTIPYGKSASFPVTGYMSAAYHTPGTEIVGTNVKANERLIVIGDTLVAAAFIPNIDEMLNHYDIRSVHANEMGDILARTYDQNVARTGILNARGAAIVDGLQGGSSITNANMATDGTVLYQSIFNSGVLLDQKDIPFDDRSTFIRPVQYALVVQSEKPINFDLNQGSLDNGSIAMGTVRRINNMELVKTNNLPNANDSANANIPTTQQGDFSKTQFLSQHRNAIGTVQMQDITSESTWDPRRLGTLMTARYLVGHGSLRPEAGVEGAVT